MLDLRCGVKIYDNAWFLQHGLGVEEAADLLSAMGVTYVISQSRYLPMSDSAVKSRVDEDDTNHYAQLDDVAFRQALKTRGIAYFACLNICFDPVFSQQNPQLLPVDQFGQTATLEDWYLGISPDCSLNLQHKINLLTKAVQILQPDGVHLGFIRWPGFWETWLPDTNPQLMPDYCYSQDSLMRFSQATGIEVAIKSPVEAARFIEKHCQPAWRDWKCTATVQAISTIRDALTAIPSPSLPSTSPRIPIAINTLPFFVDEFDGAVSRIFGQDVTKLKDVVDIFEVMAYHQILKRDTWWPAKITDDIKQRAQRRAICTIQAKSLYLDGMHAGRGRNKQITYEAFSNMLLSLEKSQADGVCVFTFSDLLAMRHKKDGQYMIDALRAFRK